MGKLFGGNAGKSGGGMDTLIGQQTEILGDVRFSGGLHVEGKIKGKVLAVEEKSSSLSISENGTIEGDVRVPNIVLNGQVTGDVHATGKITLAPKARVNGNVYYRIIEMAGGARVNGQMVHEPSGQSVAALTHESSGDSAGDQLREARRLKGVVGN
ncbi:MAG: bactofilin family protein [Stenotrophobium sp.]